MTKDLTIAIVTFNSSEIIARCLSSLGKIAQEKYDVVVIDNDSKDDTVEIVSKNFPQVKVIKNNNNIGFGRANNIALRQAETEFALILNPDAFMAVEDIEICIEILKSNPQIAIASPKTFPSLEAAKNYQISDFKNSPFSKTSFIVGGIMFLRLDIFRKIGFFDEEFFMFAEDNEISDRALMHGYTNAMINVAKAYHLGGCSSKKNLKITFRRFWHLGWSKSRYKLRRKGKFNAIRSTIRISLVYFFEGIFYFLRGNREKSVSKFAFSYGCFCFLIGLKAFKKDGSPSF